MSNNVVQYAINVVGDAMEKITNIGNAVTATGSKFSKLYGDIIKLQDLNMAFDAIESQAEKLGNMFGSVFNAGMENELQKQNLTTLLGGNIDAADTLFAKISKYGKDTVYDNAGLLQAQ